MTNFQADLVVGFLSQIFWALVIIIGIMVYAVFFQ